MKELQQLLAKEAIRDQIFNYCRALDRIDNELGYTIFSDCYINGDSVEGFESASTMPTTPTKSTSSKHPTTQTASR